MQDLVDTKKLRLFTTVVKERNMRRAAESLFLTPSAISHGIKSLEETLNTKLIDRSGHQIQPTKIGKQFYNVAEDILSRLDAATARFADGGNNNEQQQLRIGLTNTACSYILPGIVREFRESCPDVSLKLDIGDTDYLLNLLNDRKIDIAIAPIQRDYEGFEQKVIGEDELVYIVPPAHPWVASGKIDRSTLADEHIIMPAVSSNTYNLIDARYREYRMPLKPFIELNNENTIKQLVALNMGTGIIPSWIARKEIENGRLHAFRMPKRPLRRRWTISHHPNVPNNLTEFLFIGTAQAVTKTLIGKLKD